MQLDDKIVNLRPVTRLNLDFHYKFTICNGCMKLGHKKLVSVFYVVFCDVLYMC